MPKSESPSRKRDASLDSCITQGYAIMHVDYDLCQVGLILHETTPCLYGIAFLKDWRASPSRNLVSSDHPTKIRSAITRTRLINNYPFPSDMRAIPGYIRMITIPTPLANIPSETDMCNVVWELNLD